MQKRIIDDHSSSYQRRRSCRSHAPEWFVGHPEVGFSYRSAFPLSAGVYYLVFPTSDNPTLCSLAVIATFWRVSRNAASSSGIALKVPMTQSISESRIVARLSVMITESINQPQPLALSLSILTSEGDLRPNGRPGQPRQAVAFEVRKFESGNRTKTTSPRR